MKKTGLFKHHAVRIGLSLLLVLPLLLHTLGAINLNVIQRLENYTYDLRLQWTMPNTLDKRIVILDIDEKSLQEQGHWPWPRNKLAHMVDTLFDRYQIDVLGFDILFAERDESSGLKRLEALAQTELHGDANFKTALDKLKPGLDYDQVFADSLKNRRVVLGYYFRHDTQLNSSVGALPAPALAKGSFEPLNVGAVVSSGFTANLPELQKNAASGGFFNASPLVAADGVFRRISLLQMNNGALYETLGLAMARLALREPALELGYADADKNVLSLEYLKLGKRHIPVDIDVAALIPYRGKQGSFTYVSASDVLKGTASPDLLKDTIVLVGTTAPGLLDFRIAPMQESYAGVEAHANLVAGILDGNVKGRPAYTLG
ncbi:MAG: CHASE2 domain-containing protein, partial [Pseudomonadota bacterium]